MTGSHVLGPLEPKDMAQGTVYSRGCNVLLGRQAAQFSLRYEYNFIQLLTEEM